MKKPRWLFLDVLFSTLLLMSGTACHLIFPFAVVNLPGMDCWRCRAEIYRSVASGVEFRQQWELYAFPYDWNGDHVIDASDATGYGESALQNYISIFMAPGLNWHYRNFSVQRVLEKPQACDDSNICGPPTFGAPIGAEISWPAAGRESYVQIDLLDDNDNVIDHVEPAVSTATVRYAECTGMPDSQTGAWLADQAHVRFSDFFIRLAPFVFPNAGVSVDTFYIQSIGTIIGTGMGGLDYRVELCDGKFFLYGHGSKSGESDDTSLCFSSDNIYTGLRECQVGNGPYFTFSGNFYLNRQPYMVPLRIRFGITSLWGQRFARHQPQVALAAQTVQSTRVLLAPLICEDFDGDANGSLQWYENFESSTERYLGTGLYCWADLSKGTHTITAVIYDGRGSHNTGSAVITVANTPPVAYGDGNYSTAEGLSLTVPAPGVLANDTDVENDPLSAVLADGPSHGAVVLNANGSFVYTPTAGYTGEDSFTYYAYDGKSASLSQATVTIRINKARFYDVRWWSEVDHDGDGYKSQTALAWDVDVSSGLGTLTVYEKIYRLVYLLGRPIWLLERETQPHTINGTAYEWQTYTVNGVPHGEHAWYIEVYRVGKSTWDDARDGSTDPELLAYQLETSAEDGMAELAVSPLVLSASCAQGSSPASQSFEVWNKGAATLSYTISDNVNWLVCNPTSGTSTGEHDPIAVNYSASGLAAGTYHGTITVAAAGANASPQMVEVTLTVNPALPVVTVAATDAMAGEPGTTYGTGTFTFTRTVPLTSALTVNFTVGGTATAGSDYTSLGTTVSFAAGSATATKTVSVINDTLVEPDETVVVTLASGTGYTVGSPSTATVTIKDDDSSTSAVIVDNADATGVTIVGTWTGSTSSSGYWPTNYLHDGNTGKGTKSVTFRPTLPAAGNYEVSVWYTAGSNRATNVPADIVYSGGTRTVLVNERVNGSQWVVLGTNAFAAGTTGYLRIRTTGTTSGYVIADAVRFRPVAVTQVIVDNADSTGVTIVGTWTGSTSSTGYWRTNYLHDGNTGKGSKSVTFRPTLPSAGNYEVSVWYTAGSNRATNVPMDIVYSGGTRTVLVNERVNGSQWVVLGTNAFAAGTTGYLRIRTTGTTSGYVIADAVRFRPVAVTQVIVDNADTTGVTIVGTWTGSTSSTGYWRTNYLHDGNTGKGSKSVTFQPTLASAGNYEVSVWYTEGSNRATNVPMDIVYSGGTRTVLVNERVNGSKWVVLGTNSFAAGTTGYLRIRTTGTASGYVIADAVRFKLAGVQ